MKRLSIALCLFCFGTCAGAEDSKEMETQAPPKLDMTLVDPKAPKPVVLSPTPLPTVAKKKAVALKKKRTARKIASKKRSARKRR